MDKVEVGIMERDGREGVSHFRWSEMKQYQIIIINQYQIQKCKLFAGTEKFITAIFADTGCKRGPKLWKMREDQERASLWQKRN